MDIIQNIAGSGAVAFFIHSLVSLFVTVDAVGNAPVFLALLQGVDEAQREYMIKKAVVIAAMSLTAMAFTGNIIFRLLYLEVFIFNIPGGIILLLVSIGLLLGRGTKTVPFTNKGRTMAAVPLAFPLLAGPGAITTVIVLFNVSRSLVNKTILICNIILVFAATYVILVKAKPISSFLGEAGMRAVRRIMGIILLTVAVRFIVEGIQVAVQTYR